MKLFIQYVNLEIDFLKQCLIRPVKCTYTPVHVPGKVHQYKRDLGKLLKLRYCREAHKNENKIYKDRYKGDMRDICRAVARWRKREYEKKVRMREK